MFVSPGNTAMLRQIRILAGGVIAAGDRRMHVTGKSGQGGPDLVQWVRMPGDNERYTIVFDKNGTPFGSGVTQIQVPPGGPETVTTDPAGGYGRSYAYSVYDAAGKRTDDPDVVVD